MAIEITPARDKKFKHTIANTQQDVAVVLENVHDAHNIGAVIRSCDAVGVRTIYIVDTHIQVQEKRKIEKASSTGVARWMDILYFTDLDTCMSKVTKNYSEIWATHLGRESISLYDVDLTTSCALVFGNEHAGITDEMLSFCTGNLIIPQKGMVQSLNISVACAVTLFEALRQRIAAGFYTDDFNMDSPLHNKMYKKFREEQLESKKPNQ